MALLAIGCGSDDDGGGSALAPDFPTGPGRLYAYEATFSSVDGVRVAGIYGPVPGPGPHPVVILVHEIGNALNGRDEWLQPGALFHTLLENGYSALAIDLRGHGNTLWPQDRSQPQLLLTDLEDMHLDVRAAISWLRNQDSVDGGRIAVIGNGIGGNIAYVSMGAFPNDLQAGVALSPGLWDPQSFEPLAVGAGINPFAPHNMLYLVGSNDVGVLNQTELSYQEFAASLASRTRDPGMAVFDGVAIHGIDLLASPVSVQLILDWLQTHL